LNRKIDELIRVPLSKKILFEQLSNCAITAHINEQVIEFDVVKNSTAVVDAAGFIRAENDPS
jgi:hypothetical protein